MLNRISLDRCSVVLDQPQRFRPARMLRLVCLLHQSALAWAKRSGDA